MQVFAKTLTLTDNVKLMQGINTDEIITFTHNNITHTDMLHNSL